MLSDQGFPNTGESQQVAANKQTHRLPGSGDGRLYMQRLDAGSDPSSRKRELEIVALSVICRDPTPTTGTSWLQTLLPSSFPYARILHISILLSDDMESIVAELEPVCLRLLKQLESATSPGVSCPLRFVHEILVNTSDRRIPSYTFV